MTAAEPFADILDSFPLDLDATSRVTPENLSPDTRLYQVNDSRLIDYNGWKGNNYIIDSAAGAKVACHPHIVGAELRKLCMDAAHEFTATVESLGLLGDNPAVMHILRAGAGYMVAEAFDDRLPVINVRTQYKEEAYRDHSDDPRDIVVTYRDYPDGLGDVSTLIIPDTYATGRSAETAIQDAVERGVTPERVVIYGFIAAPSLSRIGKLCQRLGVDFTSFTICDITQLAHNNYDMCVYGPDESRIKATGEYRALGSVIDRDTLLRLLPDYVPGMDQPGDWSERQAMLFNGYENEHGNIKGHIV